MKKKLLILTLLAISSMTLFVGCGAKAPTSDKDEKPQVEESKPNKEKILVSVDEIELVDFKLVEEYDEVYMEAKFKNNSKENIKAVTYIYDVGGEKSYLSTYDTMLPGDVSTKENTTGPASGNPDDVKLLSVEIDVANEDGTTTYIQYDAKLNKYKTDKY